MNEDVVGVEAGARIPLGCVAVVFEDGTRELMTKDQFEELVR